MKRLCYTIAALCLCATSTNVFALTKEQERVLKEAITENFKDPESAKFRNIELVHTTEDARPGEGVYCGEVNAKNSYGGYVGFMPFIGAVVGTGALAIRVADDADSAGIANELCRRSRAGEF